MYLVEHQILYFVDFTTFGYLWPLSSLFSILHSSSLPLFRAKAIKTDRNQEIYVLIRFLSFRPFSFIADLIDIASFLLTQTNNPLTKTSHPDPRIYCKKVLSADAFSSWPFRSSPLYNHNPHLHPSLFGKPSLTISLSIGSWSAFNTSKQRTVQCIIVKFQMEIFNSILSLEIMRRLKDLNFRAFSFGNLQTQKCAQHLKYKYIFISRTFVSRLRDNPVVNYDNIITIEYI